MYEMKPLHFRFVHRIYTIRKRFDSLVFMFSCTYVVINFILFYYFTTVNSELSRLINSTTFYGCITCLLQTVKIRRVINLFIYSIVFHELNGGIFVPLVCHFTLKTLPV